MHSYSAHENYAWTHRCAVRRAECIKLGQVKRAQGRPKKTWMEVIRHDTEAKDLNEGILLDRNEWRKLIHVPDPT